MSAQLLPSLVERDFANNGSPLAFGYVYTYIAGTSTPQATWTDSTQAQANTNPVQLNARGEASIWIDVTLDYKLIVTDSLGNIIRTVDQVQGSLTAGSLTAILTQSYLSGILWPQTATELSVGVTPSNYYYQFGDPRRYGATGATATTSGTVIPSVDDSAAWLKCCLVGLCTLPQNFAMKVVTQNTVMNIPVIVLGQGPLSQLFCDGFLAQVYNGTGSILDNFALYNITTPYVINRAPSSWGSTVTSASVTNTAAALPTLTYQPTINDPEYATLYGIYGSQLSALVSPGFWFIGPSSNIRISRIYGRFVNLLIQDTQFSTVSNCNFRGGRGPVTSGSGGGGGPNGCICFDNQTNYATYAIQGQGNQAVNNTIQGASFSGVTLVNNVSGRAIGNWCCYNGESGIKTDSLPNPSFRMTINDNTTENNYFDGIDAFTAFPGADTLAAFNEIVGNKSYGNGGTGANIDGKYNIVCDNQFSINGRYGVNNYSSLSKWSGNIFSGNNTSAGASQADFQCGLEGNSITGNIINWGGTGSSMYGVQAALVCAVTATNASPAVFTITGTVPGALSNGMQIALGGTAVPTGFTAYNPATNTPIYYTVACGVFSAGTFELSATLGGSAINSTSTGTAVTATFMNLCGTQPHYIAGNQDLLGTSNFGNPGQIFPMIYDHIDATSATMSEDSFTLQITNTSGTLQHAFYSDPGGLAQSNAINRIIGYYNSLVNTPTATDNMTAFASGGKISSANTNLFICNTAAQTTNYSKLSVSASSTIASGAVIGVTAQFSTVNVNGVNIARLCFQFFNSVSGANFALTTGNIASGKTIYVQFSGKLM